MCPNIRRESHVKLLTKNGFFTYAKYLDHLQRTATAPDEEFDTVQRV